MSNAALRLVEAGGEMDKEKALEAAISQIERACGMLLDPRIPIAGIAHDLGFADQAHFTHMFRRRTGCTPGAWRRAARGGSSKTTRSGNSFR
mgnify:CR=1 FL=1